MNQTELDEILAAHKLWLVSDGEEGQRANLTGVDLTGAHLTGAHLTRADLTDANLTGANLTGANLYGANLYGANLYGVSMARANLYGVIMVRTNLTRTNLTSANLTNANLNYANLTSANLTSANLTDAEIWGTIGNRREIKTIAAAEEYVITYTADRLQIGCQNYAIKDWWEFYDTFIRSMDGRRAINFWREWKDIIRKIIEAAPAEPTGHED